jgi:hypothetical protein
MKNDKNLKIKALNPLPVTTNKILAILRNWRKFYFILIVLKYLAYLLNNNPKFHTFSLGTLCKENGNLNQINLKFIKQQHE